MKTIKKNGIVKRKNTKIQNQPYSSEMQVKLLMIWKEHTEEREREREREREKQEKMVMGSQAICNGVEVV